MARWQDDAMDRVRASIGELPEALLADPITFLMAEHARQRVLLGHLERLARSSCGPARVAIARALAAWIASELPMHLADEGASIFPRLGPEAAQPLSAIARDAAALDAARLRLCAELAHVVARHRVDDGLAACVTTFVTLYRRRVAEEEAMLFPLARRILDHANRAAVEREMAERRH